MTEEQTQIPESKTEPEKEPEKESEDVKQTEDLISKANVAAARQEDANKQLERLLARQERLNVEAQLSGTSRAGSQEKTKEQKEIESAKEMLKGTGYEDVLFPEEKKDLDKKHEFYNKGMPTM